MCGSDGMIAQRGATGREQARWTDGNARYVALHANQDQATAWNEINKRHCRSLPAAGQRAGWGSTAVFAAAKLR